MQVQNINNSPAFSARFVNNKAFNEVVDLAAQTKKLRALDDALHRIKTANEGDILITHGMAPTGGYSNFTMGKRAVVNLGAQCSPAEASLNGILELGTLGRKFRKLAGGDVKENLSKADIVKNYTKIEPRII